MPSNRSNSKPVDLIDHIRRDEEIGVYPVFTVPPADNQAKPFRPAMMPSPKQPKPPSIQMVTVKPMAVQPNQQSFAVTPHGMHGMHGGAHSGAHSGGHANGLAHGHVQRPTPVPSTQQHVLNQYTQPVLQPFQPNVIPTTRRAGSFEGQSTMSPYMKPPAPPTRPPVHLSSAPRPWTKDFVPLPHSPQPVNPQPMQPKDIASIIVAPHTQSNAIPVTAGFQTGAKPVILSNLSVRKPVQQAVKETAAPKMTAQQIIRQQMLNSNVNIDKKSAGSAPKSITDDDLLSQPSDSSDHQFWASITSRLVTL